MKKMIEPSFEICVFENAVHTAENSDKAVDLFEIIEDIPAHIVGAQSAEELDDTFNNLVERIKNEGAVNVWEDIQAPVMREAHITGQKLLSIYKETKNTVCDFDPDLGAALLKNTYQEYSQFLNQLDNLIYEKDGKKSLVTQEGAYKAAGIKFQND